MYLVRPTAKIMKALSESDILSAFFQRSPQREQFVSKQFHGSEVNQEFWRPGASLGRMFGTKTRVAQRIHGQVCTCKNNDPTNKTVCWESSPLAQPQRIYGNNAEWRLCAGRSPHRPPWNGSCALGLRLSVARGACVIWGVCCLSLSFWILVI